MSHQHSEDAMHIEKLRQTWMHSSLEPLSGQWTPLHFRRPSLLNGLQKTQQLVRFIVQVWGACGRGAYVTIPAGLGIWNACVQDPESSFALREG